MSIHKAHILIVLIAVFCIFPNFSVSALETELTQPNINGQAAVLMDATTGTVLYAKNPNQRMFPASITKIVTAIIALESVNPADIVTISKEARYEEGTRVYLAESEKQSMENLIYAVLMNSGNDAATAVAEYIDGTKKQFSIRMNKFVKHTIGTSATQFTNPHGLYDPNHYTTAMDMALIAKYSMLNDTFREIVATKTKPWEGKEWKSKLINHNKLLWRYDGATGIKNGYTKASGFTLVASAKRGETELIGVVLNSSTSEQIYKDMTVLLDFGLNNFQSKLILEPHQTMTYHNGLDQQVFVATERVWITVVKDEQPIVSVDEKGNLFIDSTWSDSDASIATLTPMKIGKPAKIVATEEIPITTSVQLQESKRRYPLTDVRLLVFVFMTFLAFMVLVIRRYRRTKIKDNMP